MSTPNDQPPQQPAPMYYPPQPVIQPKTPLLHAVVSAFVPGVGSMMGGAVGAGVALLLSWFLAMPTVWTITLMAAGGAVVSVPADSAGSAAAGGAIAIFVVGLITFALYVAAIWHGYRSAKRWNEARGIVS